MYAVVCTQGEGSPKAQSVMPFPLLPQMWLCSIHTVVLTEEVSGFKTGSIKSAQLHQLTIS